MSRTDDDTWDLATSVGATATLVAAARALASRQDDPLVTDPFAEPLVRAVGIPAFTRALDGEDAITDTDSARLLIDVVAVRTRFFDDFLLEAGAAGLRQAVILASGLDSRAYRLPWPAGTTVFEVDQPEVIDFKSRVLAEHGASPAAERRTVGVDLRDDWAAALRAHGFDSGVPTAWIAEGLLIYLPPEAQDRLFDTITALSAPGSRIATEYHPDGGSGIAQRASSMSAQLADNGLDLNLGDLFYDGRRHSVVDYLENIGWQVRARPRPEMFAAYGRSFPADPADQPLRNSFSVTAIRKAAV
ncbi:MAG: class I SAM-dependent methyltransferase [Mycobacteriaceae bacterium]